MATMIPNLCIDSIENEGERDFYRIASSLPDYYTVLYSYNYQEIPEDVNYIREADFVIVHSNKGYIVVEVKQGSISYHNETWYEVKDENYLILRKDPVEQARTAMFNILKAYKSRMGGKEYPLAYGFAVCFPTTTKFTGILPQGIDKKNIWTLNELDDLDTSISAFLDIQKKEVSNEANKTLLKKILAPSFKVFSRPEDQIAIFHRKSEVILSVEQERILDETEEDTRKVFFGAAGTGKTYIAMEKAKRLAEKNKKVFLTCYNRNLSLFLNKHINDENIKVLNFLDYIERDLKEKGIIVEKPKDSADLSVYYNETLSTAAFDYYTNVEEEDKYDAIIVDEGQDFIEEWMICLLTMVKEDGHFYVFADDKQNIFKKNTDALHRFEISKHRLTINFRNSQKINEWFAPFVKDSKLRSKLKGGLPVQTFKCKNTEEEKEIIKTEICKLVSQGFSPNRITILSPYTKAKSCLKNNTKIGDWPINEINEQNSSGIKYSTIKSFKGLESDIVFLIDINNNKFICTDEDVYVGASRARYMLYVTHHEKWEGFS